MEENISSFQRTCLVPKQTSQLGSLVPNQTWKEQYTTQDTALCQRPPHVWIMTNDLQ